MVVHPMFCSTERTTNPYKIFLRCADDFQKYCNKEACKHKGYRSQGSNLENAV